MRAEVRAEYDRRMSEYERILTTAKRMYATGEVPAAIRLDSMLEIMESTDEAIRKDIPGVDPLELKLRVRGWLVRLTQVDHGTDGRAWRAWFDANANFGKKVRDPDLAEEISYSEDGSFFEWRIPGMPEEDLRDGLRFRLVASVYADATARYALTPSQRRAVRSGEVNAVVIWNGGRASQRIELRDLETVTMAFTGDRPPANEPYVIRLEPLPGPASFIVGRGSVSVIRTPGLFELNLAKSLVLTWSVAAFLATVGVCAGSFLSFPVALLLTIFVLFWGSTVGIMREMTRPAPENPLFEVVDVDPDGHDHKGHDLASRLGEYISEGSWFGVFLRNGMADFSKYEGAKYVPVSLRIPDGLVMESLLAFLAWRTLLLLFIGWLFIRKQEF
jgi:hypothetical protein